MQFTGKRFEMTTGEYQEYEEEMVGLCLACGEERDSCEPDATEYQCKFCEKQLVYGVPELLMRGLVDLVGDEDDE